MPIADIMDAGVHNPDERSSRSECNFVGSAAGIDSSSKAGSGRSDKGIGDVVWPIMPNEASWECDCEYIRRSVGLVSKRNQGRTGVGVLAGRMCTLRPGRRTF